MAPLPGVVTQQQLHLCKRCKQSVTLAARLVGLQQAYTGRSEWYNCILGMLLFQIPGFGVSTSDLPDLSWCPTIDEPVVWLIEYHNKPLVLGWTWKSVRIGRSRPHTDCMLLLWRRLTHPFFIQHCSSCSVVLYCLWQMHNSSPTCRLSRLKSYEQSSTLPIFFFFFLVWL